MTMVEPQNDPLIGRKTGRYEIVQVIGTGAMARVYQARDTATETSCALKVLSREAAQNTNLLERFRREAWAMSSIRHRNVVAVLDLIETPELVALVMELVRGKTLSSFLHRNVRFEVRRTAQIMRELASGLAAIHAAGFVHRDLKPSNIMLAGGEENPETVKILDLGMVGFAPGGPVGKRITDKGFTVGTASYMAPEQAFDASVGPAADLYSLGVIGHEMLYGRAPDRARSGLTPKPRASSDPPGSTNSRVAPQAAIDAAPAALLRASAVVDGAPPAIDGAPPAIDGAAPVGNAARVRPPSNSGVSRSLTDPRGISRPPVTAFGATALDRMIFRLSEQLPSLRPSSADLVAWEIDRIFPGLPKPSAPPDNADPSKAQTDDIIPGDDVLDQPTIPERPTSRE